MGVCSELSPGVIVQKNICRCVHVGEHVKLRCHWEQYFQDVQKGFLAVLTGRKD